MRRENFFMGPMLDLAPTSRLIGYARVSTEDRRLDMQLKSLEVAGCDKVFYDHGISGGNARLFCGTLAAWQGFKAKGDGKLLYEVCMPKPIYEKVISICILYQKKTLRQNLK